MKLNGVLDIGVISDGRILLVELNDAYALSCYGLNDILYVKLISARWRQLLGRNEKKLVLTEIPEEPIQAVYRGWMMLPEQRKTTKRIT